MTRETNSVDTGVDKATEDTTTSMHSSSSEESMPELPSEKQKIDSRRESSLHSTSCRTAPENGRTAASDVVLEHASSKEKRCIQSFQELLLPNTDVLEEIHHSLIRAAILTFFLYILLAVSICVVFADHAEVLDPLERQAAGTAALLQFLGAVSRFTPLLHNTRRIQPESEQEKPSQNSWFRWNGIAIVATTVQCLSILTNTIFALGFPTPVITDPFLNHGRAYLFRFAEWAPLCALMTYWMEKVDSTTTVGAVPHAVCQFVSVLLGLVIPLCHDFKWWLATGTTATLLYFVLFLRIVQKERRLKAMMLSRPIGPHDTASESVQRVYLSLQSAYENAFVWTFLVVQHFAVPFLPLLLQWEGAPIGLPMIGQSICEALSKFLYILTAETIMRAFSDQERSWRRLEKLRQTLLLAWDNSSDAIVIGIQDKEGDGGRVCLVSPTFWRLVNASESMPSSLALVMEESSSGGASTHCCVNWEVFGSDGRQADETEESKVRPSGLQLLLVPPKVKSSVASLGELVTRAWNCKDGKSLLHDMKMSCSGDDDEIYRRCETTVSKLKSESVMVLTVRDISERVKCFEAEKKLAVQLKEREKDTQTTRFTRHEVKNGLLAAIGLCDGLKANPDLKLNPEHQKRNSWSSTSSANQVVFELDTVLNEVLDTVLSEAMSRDVIHEVYALREETIDVVDILKTSTRNETKRFPISSIPEKLPPFVLDPQLFRFIVRNAISNACKYGQIGGEVVTELEYSEKANLLTVRVINQPGEHHDELVALGSEVASRVFVQGQRLHGEFKGSRDEREASVSSGDGAWIMKKCATMLGGRVGIRFNPERTIFSLVMPSKISMETENPLGSDTTFSVPRGTIGIAFDDSKVQRKLLDRLLSFVGITKECRYIFGETAKEVLDFNTAVRTIVEENPDSRFLIVVDENLDIVEDSVRHSTISGSVCAERLRHELNAADEARILTLVRSANDSSEDVALYQKRAHGFLPKAPIRKDAVIAAVGKIWKTRFPKSIAETFNYEMELSSQDLAFADGVVQDILNPTEPADLSSSAVGGSKATSTMTTGEDLVQQVKRIDELSPESDWKSFSEKLQVLKGDTMTLIDAGHPRVCAVVDALDDLRDLDEPPVDFVSRWKLIRALILSLV